MKKFKFFLLMTFLVAIISFPQSCEQDDPDLEETLRQLKQNRKFIQNKRFPDLPTEEDFNQLEATLFRPGVKFPNSLKIYHLTLGNLVFGGGSFPSAHSIKNDSEFRSNLLYFIREGHERGVPYNQEETWIPFGDDGSDYVCMNLQTGSVCYFSFVPRLKKDKAEYLDLSTWLKERFLSK